MKSRSATELLDRLAERARKNIDLLEGLAQLPEEALHRRPQAGAWTALEALEHLNAFNDEYYRRTERAIRGGRTVTTGAAFTSSWLGNIVANWARPGGSTIKLPTLGKMNFRERALGRATLDTCLNNERQLARMVEGARGVDLTHGRIATTEVSFIKLRLGDVLRMLVNHDWRHIEQAERATRGEAGIRTAEEI